MSRILKVLLATAGAVSLAAAAGLAQPAPQAGGPDSALNLTDAQRDEIRKLREETRAAAREEAQKLRDATRQLREEFFADHPDQGKIASLKSEIAQRSQQLQARRLEQQERMSRIFTPEQRRLLRDRRAMMQERRELMRERRQLMQEHRRLGRQMRRELRMRPFRGPLLRPWE
jgi:Spy/CpxP family protein refolding chaperone